MSSRNFDDPKLLPPIEAALDVLWAEAADHAAVSVREEAASYPDNRIFLAQVRRLMSELDMAQRHVDGIREHFMRNSKTKLAEPEAKTAAPEPKP